MLLSRSVPVPLDTQQYSEDQVVDQGPLLVEEPQRRKCEQNGTDRVPDVRANDFRRGTGSPVFFGSSDVVPVPWGSKGSPFNLWTLPMGVARASGCSLPGGSLSYTGLDSPVTCISKECLLLLLASRRS